MRTVFKRIRANNKYALYPFLLTQAVFGLLVGAIVAVLFSSGASSDMTNGMVFSAGVSIVPFFLGLLMTIKHSVVCRAKEFRSLMTMGVSKQRIIRSIRFEIILGSLLAGLVGGLFGRYALLMMVKTLYGRLGGEMPEKLPSPVMAVPIIFLIVFLLGLLSSRKAVLVGLKKEKPAKRKDGRSPFKGLSVFVWISLTLTIFLSISIVAVPPSFGLVAASIYVLPFTLASSSPFLLALWATLSIAVGKKLTGWSPWTISAREVLASSGNLVFGVMILFICLPLSLFASNSAAIHAARASAANQVNDVKILAGSDGALLEPKTADQLCKQLDDDCIGVTSWSYAKKSSSGEHVYTPSGLDEGTDYVLTGENNTLEAVLSGEKPGTVESAFSQEWMVPWAHVESTDETDQFAHSRMGSVVVLSVSAISRANEINAGNVRSVSFKELMNHLPERIFYGPGGTGTSEFVPLFASVILGGSVLVFALLVGRQVLYLPTLRSLAYLGVSPNRIKSVRMLANIHLASGALIACLVFYFITYSIMLSSSGHFRLGFPNLSVGLVVYLVAIVFMSTLLSSFFTTGSESKELGS